MFNLKLSPVSPKSKTILQKADFGLIGISPFNSYFSVENIISILHLVIEEFKDFAIFIPDKISSYTLLALGYEEKRVNFKIRKQDNYLKNKALRALSEIGKDYKIDTSNKIITLSSLLDNPHYVKNYNWIKKMFNDDKNFEHGCIRTSNWIISNHSKYYNSTVDSKSLTVAVQYFLRELPVFLCASEILNVNSCCFIYPSIPEFLSEIYNNYDFTSKDQGFATIGIVT
jgi:cyclo(L-tyrosyl-L-tyrosyl) synthase